MVVALRLGLNTIRTMSTPARIGTLLFFFASAVPVLCFYNGGLIMLAWPIPSWPACDCVCGWVVGTLVYTQQSEWGVKI